MSNIEIIIDTDRYRVFVAQNVVKLLWVRVGVHCEVVVTGPVTTAVSGHSYISYESVYSLYIHGLTRVSCEQITKNWKLCTNIANCCPVLPLLLLGSLCRVQNLEWNLILFIWDKSWSQWSIWQSFNFGGSSERSNMWSCATELYYNWIFIILCSKIQGIINFFPHLVCSNNKINIVGVRQIIDNDKTEVMIAHMKYKTQICCVQFS